MPCWYFEGLMARVESECLETDEPGTLNNGMVMKILELLVDSLSNAESVRMQGVCDAHQFILEGAEKYPEG